MKASRFRYSPTQLNLMQERCPRAIDFYQSREIPRFEDVFMRGVAAHHILEAVGHATNKAEAQLTEEQVLAIADVAERKVIEGAEYRGRQIIVKPQQAFEGKQLALEWIRREPPQPKAVVEYPIAFDREWNKVPWEHPSARMRLIFDRVDNKTYEDEEDYSYDFVEVTDYKTSWVAGKSDLESVQMRAQFIAAYILWGESDKFAEIKIRIANLQFARPFDKAYALGDDDTKATFEEYKRQLGVMMDAADAQAAKGNRHAIICEECCGCPYLLKCEAAQAAFESMAIPATSEDRARKYIVADAMRSELGKVLKEETKKTDGIVLENGTVVGHKPVTKKSITVEHSRAVVKSWMEKPGASMDGLLVAMGGLGAGQVGAIAKVLHKEKEQQEEFVSTHSGQKPSTEFSIYRKEQ